MRPVVRRRTFVGSRTRFGSVEVADRLSGDGHRDAGLVEGFLQAGAELTADVPLLDGEGLHDEADHDVLAVVDRREAELKAARATVVQLEAEVASLKAELSAALEGAGQDTPGIAPDPALRPADSAYAPVRDVSGDLVPDYEDFGDPLPDEDDPLSWLNGDDRPVRPGGRR